MNDKIARELRQICNPVDPVSKRVYRRLKKTIQEITPSCTKRLYRHPQRNNLQIGRSTRWEPSG